MVERRTANGVEEVKTLTGYSCPKAMRAWLGILGIRWIPGHLVVDKDLYHERVRLYNTGKLPATRKTPK